MDEARAKVLQMLADGKLNVEEAERLLDRLDSGSGESSAPAPATKGPSNPKYLRVIVEDSDGSRVNVRVPMALLRAGIRLGALMPEHAREEVEHAGLDLADLSKLNPDELIEALSDLEVTVDGDAEQTQKVRVFCE
jgi:hypothetical protein